jgi:ankyrin repeat protein
MTEFFFSKIMDNAGLMVAGAVVSIAMDALGGQDVKSRIAGFRKTAASHIRQRLDLGRPPSPATNHDLRRALCLAYTGAARPWVRAVAALPPHEFSEDQRKEKDAFLERVRKYLGAAERAAYDRTASFEGWTGEGLMAALLDAVPESTLEGEDGAAVTRSLTEAFSTWIAGKEGQGLPEAAHYQLFETSGADEVVLFGQSVLQAFIEILKSGDYIEATRAFEQRVAAGLRDGVRAIAAEVEVLGGDIARLGPALSRVETLIDQSALSLARVENKTDCIEALTRSIESRLASQGALNLDLKLGWGNRDNPLRQMTFFQRRTTFVGRDGELVELRAFLDDPASFSWWQIAGSGGQGKSRLALSLIEELAGRWDAGFLSAEDLRAFNWGGAHFSWPTLCVIDYAAAPGKGAEVVRVLETLAKRARGTVGPPLGARVRILVLERVGYDFGEDGSRLEPAPALNWLRSALGGAAWHALKATVFQERSALVLRDLHPDDMRTIGRSWRDFLGKPPLSGEQEETLITTLRQRGDVWRPLFAMMYASVLDEILDGKAPQGSSDIERILDRTLADERDTLWGGDWERRIPADAPARALSCLATMIGTVTEDQIFSDLVDRDCVLETLDGLYGDPSGADGKEACLLLGYTPMAHPQKDPVFRGREPDLLGEYVVLWCLDSLSRRKRDERVRALIWHGALLSPDALFGFLMRLRQDFPNHPMTGALSAAPWPKGEYADADTNIPAYFGLSGRLRAMLDGGASPSRPQGNGAFPLLFAAQNGHMSCVEALLASGADPNAVDEKTGTFPLLMAAQEGYVPCVDVLLASGADPNAVNENNGTFPLLQATQNGHVSCVDALLVSEADPNAVHEKDGAFPLLQAAQEGHVSCVDALLASGADVNAVNKKNGLFPLLQAAHRGHVSCVAALLASGADVNAVNDKTGTFPLLLASQNGYESCVDALLASGADPNVVNEKTGTFPLLLAAQEGHVSCVEALLAAGADPNVENEKTATFPLLIAAQQGHVSCVDALLAAGARPLPFYLRPTEGTAGLPLLLGGPADWTLPPVVSGAWREWDLSAIPERDLVSLWLSQSFSEPPGIAAARLLELPFLRRGSALELLVVPQGVDQPESLLLLVCPEALLHVDGQSRSFHVLRKLHRSSFDLATEAGLSSYLRCLYASAMVEGGVLQIVEGVGDLSWTAPPAPEDLDAVAKVLHPVTLLDQDSAGARLQAVVADSGLLFDATFQVTSEGEVQMLDPPLFLSDLPLYRHGFEGRFRRRW